MQNQGVISDPINYDIVYRLIEEDNVSQYEPRCVRFIPDLYYGSFWFMGLALLVLIFKICVS